MNPLEHLIDLATHELKGGQNQLRNHGGRWCDCRIVNDNGDLLMNNVQRWRKKPEPMEIVEHRIGDQRCVRCFSGDEAWKKICKSHQGGTLHYYVEDVARRVG